MNVYAPLLPARFFFVGISYQRSSQSSRILKVNYTFAPRTQEYYAQFRSGRGQTNTMRKQRVDKNLTGVGRSPREMSVFEQRDGFHRLRRVASLFEPGLCCLVFARSGAQVGGMACSNVPSTRLEPFSCDGVVVSNSCQAFDND